MDNEPIGRNEGQNDVAPPTEATVEEQAMPCPDAAQTDAPVKRRTTKDNPWAIAGIVLAFLLAPVGFVLGIAGVIYSKRLDGAGKGLSVAAIVIGALITVAVVLACVFLVLLFRDMAVAIIEGIQQNIDNGNAAAVFLL